ncbi:Positive regulator of CheA protein activity (CheW) [gamma proteobacterium IMCC2047]|nr:Positive regulator of CheA protein activity (CheW) [gamma proteobacterium IMCC2047]
MSEEQIQQDGGIDLNPNALQFLTFILNGEEYGVDILKVQGIQGWSKVTPIPNTPDFMLGVINLRGAVVPIVDLRKRFQLDQVDYGPTTVVIVVKVKGDEGERVVGMVVDAVSEVYNVNERDIKPSPNFSGSISTEYIRGLSMIENKMVILLEIDSLINTGVLDLVPSELVV